MENENNLCPHCQPLNEFSVVANTPHKLIHFVSILSLDSCKDSIKRIPNGEERIILPIGDRYFPMFFV